MDFTGFNDKYRLKTKLFAIEVIRFYSGSCKKNEELRIIGKQLLRSGTSVAANFRAFTRGRSEAERFSKLCVVVEEADETQFWIELIVESSMIEFEKIKRISDEINELVKIFTSLKTKMRA